MPGTGMKQHINSTECCETTTSCNYMELYPDTIRNVLIIKMTN